MTIIKSLLQNKEPDLHKDKGYPHRTHRSKKNRKMRNTYAEYTGIKARKQYLESRKRNEADKEIATYKKRGII